MLTNEPTLNQEQDDKQPSHQEMLAFLKESIELATLQADLQEQRERYMVSRARETQAMGHIAQMTAEPNQQEAPAKSRSLKKEPV